MATGDAKFALETAIECAKKTEIGIICIMPGKAGDLYISGSIERHYHYTELDQDMIAKMTPDSKTIETH